jgi:hypothetical protein
MGSARGSYAEQSDGNGYVLKSRQLWLFCHATQSVGDCRAGYAAENRGSDLHPSRADLRGISNFSLHDKLCLPIGDTVLACKP